MQIDDENFYAFRGQWLDYLVERRDFTHGEFRVAYFIASKINPSDRVMWWSVPKIAREMRISLSTVTGATDHLEKAGLLVVSKGPKGAHYRSMRMPLDPLGAALQAEPRKRKKSGGRKSRVSKIETG